MHHIYKKNIKDRKIDKGKTLLENDDKWFSMIK